MRIEIRNDSVILDGYVNAVGRDSRPIPSPKGPFIEQIQPKAFERALIKTQNVDLLLNHNKSRKLGSTKEGNLELFEDNIGLRAICTVRDLEVMEKAKNKQLRGWSFGFYVEDGGDRWEEKEGITKRYVEELELLEVSIIDNTRIPAYIATSIETREDKDIMQERRGEDFQGVIVENNDETRNNDDVRIKKIYQHMKSRCYDNKDISYPNYGGRGIKVCKEWLENMEHFVNWSHEHGYTNEKSIDRVNNDGNYEPENCRWATSKEQNNNKRNNLGDQKRNIDYSLYENEIEFLKMKGGK